MDHVLIDVEVIETLDKSLTAIKLSTQRFDCFYQNYGF